MLLFRVSQGRRLGTGDEPRPFTNPSQSSVHRDEEMNPTYDDNLTDEDKRKIREDRAKAAEARAKAAGSKLKKKKEDPNKPLRGPNSENTMRWTAS